jgi:SAM-dependent methyltransferase
MPAVRVRPLALALLLAFNSSAYAQAQKDAAPAAPAAPAAAPAYEPSSGQAGKDVVWVPTPQVLVDKMLDLAKVTKSDFVMDLGSGDGRTVITAAKRGARALGVEYNPDMVELSKRNAEKEGVSANAKFVKADLFQTDFSKASVITMFLLPDINQKLRPKILELKPGTRVVSNSFDMGDWKPDVTANLTAKEGCDASWCTAHFWIVPAKAAGSYDLPQGKIELKQTYQMLSGTLETEGKSHPIEGRVRGNAVTFSAGGKTYRGRMNGGKLELS